MINIYQYANMFQQSPETDAPLIQKAFIHGVFYIGNVVSLEQEGVREKLNVTTLGSSHREYIERVPTLTVTVHLLWNAYALLLDYYNNREDFELVLATYKDDDRDNITCFHVQGDLLELSLIAGGSNSMIHDFKMKLRMKSWTIKSRNKEILSTT